MKLPNEVNKYIDYVVQTIKETIPTTSIWLYGSYAKGTYNKHSDLDIFVVTPDKSKKCIDWMRKVSGSIDRNWGLPLQIIVNYDDDFKKRCKGIYTLEKEVIKTGVKLYEQRR